MKGHRALIIGGKRRLPGALAALAAFAGGLLGPTSGTQDAVANGDTRTLSIIFTNTKESATVTFRRNGSYDAAGLKELNWLLRDWRQEESTRMDPRLFDIVWAVQREVGSREPVHAVSGYRSPATNGMLRRRSRAVSEQSQHMSGKALDFYLPDADMARVRSIAMRMQEGGVGYYPTAYNPFVHLDTGSVRAWPRMTRDQLVRLFPDGKTVHLPRDGKPLEGYDIARAEIMARGGAVAGHASYAEAESAPSDGGAIGRFFARLFGGADEEEDNEMVRQAPARTAVASRSRANTSRETLAYASASDPSAVILFGRDPEPAPARPVQVAAVLADATVASDASPASLTAPLPPQRPQDVVEVAIAADVPLPPVRPTLLAAAQLAPTVTGTTLRPSPPPRPEPAPATAPMDDDRAQLRALFAAVSGPSVSTVAKVSTAKAKQKAEGGTSGGFVASPGAGLKLGFSLSSADLDTTRFSGPAVKPLPVLR